jgi:hypothetical protein
MSIDLSGIDRNQLARETGRNGDRERGLAAGSRADDPD